MPKLGDRHARGLGTDLGAMQVARGPVAGSVLRELTAALVARLAAPLRTPPGSVMARAERDLELRVLDPAWRLGDGPRARLFGLDARNADPPDIEVLGAPAKIEAEIDAERSDSGTSRNAPARDEDDAARAARSEQEREEAEKRAEEEESSATSERERDADARAALSVRLNAHPSLTRIKVTDPDRLEASLRAVEMQGDELGRGRPPLLQKWPASGELKAPSPLKGEPLAAKNDAGKDIEPGRTAGGLPLPKEDAKAAGQANARARDLVNPTSAPLAPVKPGKDMGAKGDGAAKTDAAPLNLPATPALAPPQMKMAPTAARSGDEAKAEAKPGAAKGKTQGAGAGDAVTDSGVAPTAVPAGGGGSGGGEVAAWKGRVGGATGKVKEKEIPDSDIYVTQVKIIPADAGIVRANRLKTLEEEGKKAITPAKDPPENKVAIPEDPTHAASKMVDELCGKKLELGAVSTTLPDLVESPHHHIPVIGAHISVDKDGFEYVELPPVEGVKGAKPERIYKAGGVPPVDEKKRKKWDELQKHLTEAPASKKRALGKGVTVKEENAPPPIVVPDFAKVDVGDILARLLAEPDDFAKKAYDQARKAFYKGVLDEVPNSIGVELAKAEAPAFAAELQRVADAAGLKKEDLDKKVEERRKFLVDKKGKNQAELSKAHEQAKTDIKNGGKSFMDEVASVRARIDDEGERKAAAAKGGVDLEEQRKKRDAMYAAIDDKVAKWIVIYDGNGKRFKQGMDKAAREQMQAYQVAAQQDKWLLEKDVGDDKTKFQAAHELYEKTTGLWLKTRADEIGKVVTPAKAAIGKKTTEYQEALRGAGKDANQKIREWYDKSIGYERGWWAQFLDWILGWVAQSKKESQAWEAARAAETSEQLNKNMNFLAQVTMSQQKDLDDAAIDSMAGLGEEQKAILKEYYKDGGHDSVQALAAGLATRIRLQRQPEIIKALEAEVTACSDIGVLVAVGNKQTPGFDTDYMNRVQKVRQGVEYTWGTDEDKIFEALTGLTPIQARAIELEYEKQFGENMRKRLESELNDWLSTSHDWDRAQMLMAGDKAGAAAVELNQAMEGTFLGTGWGTDEDKIFEILRGKSAEEIEAIKKAYKDKYGKDLGAHLKDELGSGPGQTAHDVEEAQLLIDCKPEEAQAVEMDRAMRGTFLGTGWGTDRKAMEGVYDRIRKDVEEQGKKKGWTAAEIRAEVARRNAGLDTAYEKRYGKDWTDRKPGESALRTAFRDEMQGADLNLVVGLAEQDWKKVDAARIQLEHESFWYADDKVIRDAMAAQYKRDIADAKIDGYLKVDDQLKVDREWDELHVREEPPAITEEEKKKGVKTRLQFLDAWDKKKVTEARKAARKKVDGDAVADAQKKAPDNMKALAAEFNASYANIDPNTGLPMSFADVVRQDTSGADNEAVGITLEKGYLTDAEEVQYAVQGGGTDEDRLKEILKGKSLDEIKAMAGEWAKAHPAEPGDKRSDYERFRDRIREELSGRDEADIMEMVEHGEPQTPREEAERLKRRRDFEARSTNSGGTEELKLIDFQIAAMERKAAALEAEEANRPKHPVLSDDPKTREAQYAAYEKALDEWGERWEEKYDAIARQREIADESIEMHRHAVDERADVVGQIVGVAIAVVLTVVGAILTPFTGGGSAALVTMMWIALAGAVAGTAASMITKYVMKGDAYGWEEIGTDLALGVLEAVVAVLTVGVGDKLMKAGILAKLAAKGAFAQKVAGFLAHQAENLIQVVPGALAGNILNDQNYRDGNAVWNILGGTLHQVGVGMAHANALHIAMKPVRSGSERIGAALAKRFAKTPTHGGPPKVDLLELRAKPKEVLELWKAYKADNPDASFPQFKKELDAQVLARSQEAFQQHQLQRAMRKELLEHVPVAQKKALAKAPIEVMSEADFKALTGSEKAQAVTIFRRGKPTVVIKEGANLSNLGEEGLHILQAKDPATKRLIKALDETKLRNWEKLPVEEQLGLYRKKVVLEIDANEKLAASLEKRAADPHAPPETARQLQRTRESLKQLQKRLGEVDGLEPHEIAEMTADPSKKPQYLKEKPRLFAKETEGTTPEPAQPVDGSAGKPKKGVAKPKKQKPPKPESPREVIDRVLAEPELREAQLEALESLTKGRKATRGEQLLKEKLENAEAVPKTEARTTIEKELSGIRSKKPEDLAAVKAGGDELPKDRMTTRLAEGETARQVGEPWFEVGTKRVGNKWETRTDIYRHVEISDGKGGVRRETQILMRKKGNRWGVRGSEAREAGRALEQEKSLAFSEREFKEGWNTRTRRLAHQKEGKGSGFDELLVHFDDPTNPTTADLHIIEVKHGKTLPAAKKFSAVGANFEKNLQTLEANLADPEFVRTHGLEPAHIKAIHEAIAQGRMLIEIRVNPDMKLPASLGSASAGKGARTVIDKVGRMADAWRKLRMLEAEIQRQGSPRTEADLDRIAELRNKLESALKAGDSKRAAKVVNEIHRQTSDGKGTLARRYGFDGSKTKSIVRRQPTRLEEPPPAKSATATANPKGPNKGGGGGDGAPPAAEQQSASSSSKTKASPVDPTAVERVRTMGPTGNTLGWGGFDISVSLSWAKRRFRPFELQQMKRISKRLTKISELKPDDAQWAALPDAAKKQALRDATKAVMEVLKIPESRRPRVEFYNGPPGDYGSASWNFDTLAGGRLRPQTRRGVLRINLNVSVGDAVGTVVHEGRHYYQSYEAYKQSIGRKAHPMAETWRANLPGSGGTYQHSYMTHMTPAGLAWTLDAHGQRIPNPQYFTQPVERDAESFGRRVIDLLPLRWPS